MGKYNVEKRSFSTGNWYTKTSTDSRATAESAMRTHSYGRDARITDSHSGKVIASWPGDPSLYHDHRK